MFYKEFDPHFQALADAVQGTEETELQKDFVLLMVMRIIFLGFVQKKKWLGDNQTFIQDFLIEYQRSYAGHDIFYRDWLEPLFFEALNHAPGYNIYAAMPYTDATKKHSSYRHS